MKKYISLYCALFLLTAGWVNAQTDNLKMSDLREINFNIVKLIEDYETYSALSSSDDYKSFRTLFSAADAWVTCDIKYDDRFGDRIKLDEYLTLVNKYFGEMSVELQILRIGMPSFQGNIGIVEVEVLKNQKGTNKCNLNYADSYPLSMTISFQKDGKQFGNYGISEISSKAMPGKIVVFRALDPNEVAMPAEAFTIKDSVYITDNKGLIHYYVKNVDDSIAIVPVNKAYSVSQKFADYADLMKQRKAGNSPCEPGVVDFNVGKAIVLITGKPPVNNDGLEKQKDMEARMEREKKIKESEQAKKEYLAQKEKQDQLEREKVLQSKKDRKDQIQREKEMLALKKKEEKEAKNKEAQDQKEKQQLAELEKERLANKEQQEQETRRQETASNKEKQKKTVNSLPEDSLKENTMQNGKFLVGINGNYLLSGSNGPMIRKENVIDNKTTSSTSIGYGLLAGYEFKLGWLGKFQVSTGVGMDNINFKTELAHYAAWDSTLKDADGYPYRRITQLSNVKEDVKLSYLSVPLRLEKVFSIGKSGFALTLDAGLNMMFLLSEKNTMSTDASYSGYYESLAGLTISENGVYDFGHYAVSSENNIKAKSQLLSFDFGVGARQKIGSNLFVFANFNHRISNDSMFLPATSKSLSENNSKIESLMNYKNSYNLQYNYLSIGMAFNF